MRSLLPILFLLACGRPQATPPDAAERPVEAPPSGVDELPAAPPPEAPPPPEPPEWRLLGPDGVDTGERVRVASVLTAEERDWSGVRVLTDPGDLVRAARSALDYLDRQAGLDPGGVQPGMAGHLGVTVDDVRRTLAVVVETGEAEPDRLRDPTFLGERFRYVRWTGDAAAAADKGVALDRGQIRLTRYLVYREAGSLERTEGFPHALYAVPNDEAGLSDDALARRDLVRRRYSRQDVLAGVYEPGGEAEGQARPLVWLTRRGVHDAIMQGTVEVHLPDGAKRVLNVDRSNDVAYDRSHRDPERQGRYWYFRERDGIGGWGWHGDHKIAVVPGVSVAGDVYNLGVGKLIALHDDDGGVRLAVLADTGGAFQPNLYQLDLFTGTFDDHAQFQAATGHLPGRVGAGLLIAR